jgi:ribonuclease BN (tRNA processing enzyme)
VYCCVELEQKYINGNWKPNSVINTAAAAATSSNVFQIYLTYYTQRNETVCKRMYTNLKWFWPCIVVNMWK